MAFWLRFFVRLCKVFRQTFLQPIDVQSVSRIIFLQIWLRFVILMFFKSHFPGETGMDAALRRPGMGERARPGRCFPRPRS
jgi:hypothetical protein